MAKWQTVYTEQQYRDGVKSAFHLGCIEGSDRKLGTSGGGQWKNVRLRRDEKPMRFRVQVFRSYLVNGPKWMDVAEFKIEADAIGFLEDLAMCLALSSDRIEASTLKKEINGYPR